MQLLRKLLQVDAPDQLHGDEIDAPRLAQVIRLDDIGMDQIRDQFRFTNKIIDKLLLAGIILPDDLDGDPLYKVARAVLFRFVHHTHAAFEYLADDFVSELAFYGKEGHASML